MVVFRSLIFLFLLIAAAFFIAYAVTSRVRYRRYGLVILKWTLIAAFGFFAVLIAERIF